MTLYAGDEFYDDDVTSGPANHIPYRDTWAVCANCEHEMARHGHLDADRRWIIERTCWAFREPSRSADGRELCPCPGWTPGPQR